MLITSSFAESHATEKEVCTWVLPTNACRRVDFFAGVSLLALLVLVLSGLEEDALARLAALGDRLGDLAGCVVGILISSPSSNHNHQRLW